MNLRSLIYLLTACAVVGLLLGLLIPPPLSFVLSLIAGAAIGWKWPWPIMKGNDHA